LRTKNLKLVGAAGAAALTVGMVAAPAVAAPKEVDYSCFGGSVPIPITMDLGTLPTSLVAGQTVKQTISSGNVHLIADVVNIALGQGWDAVSGNTTRVTGTPYTLTIPKTTLPNPATDMDIPATGSFTLHPTKAGAFHVIAGDVTANIQGWTGSTKANVIPLDCAAPTDGSNDFGTIAVSKDKSTTKVKAAYSAKKHTATGTATVRGHFGLAGTGKVSFTLKKGTHKIKTVKVALKKGVAKVAFKHVKKKGKYSITAAFKGDAALKASSGKATFKVK
jgi:hypothetical protein